MGSLSLLAGEVLQLVGQQCSLQVCDGRLADRLAAVTAHSSHPLREAKGEEVCRKPSNAALLWYLVQVVVYATHQEPGHQTPCSVCWQVVCAAHSKLSCPTKEHGMSSSSLWSLFLLLNGFILWLAHMACIHLPTASCHYPAPSPTPQTNWQQNSGSVT